jgi:ATP-dependent DNA helicase PIF1
MNIILNPGQMTAREYIDNKINVFITGQGGTGKTELIKSIVINNKIGITSMTGISAILIGGRTLHSFLGIGLGLESAEIIYSKIKGNKFLVKKWNNLETLVVDEISMMSCELLEKLELLARLIRKNNLVFGGIHLVFSGDFCQLPSIGQNNNIDFCFNCETWSKCITKTVYLTEIIRQKNIDFQQLLSHIRLGVLSDEDKSILLSRVGKDVSMHGIEPTFIQGLNVDVDKINKNALKKLNLEKQKDGILLDFYEYEMSIENDYNLPDYIVLKFIKNLIVSKKSKFCIGAQVMLLTNLDMDSSLCNGSRGIIINFCDNIPVVKFYSGQIAQINFHTWDYTDGFHIIKATQIPLKLAYSISIHKMQGSTLDCAKINLKNIFEYGQAYVAISRVRTLEGLSITDIDFDNIQANPIAISYYHTLLNSHGNL